MISSENLNYVQPRESLSDKPVQSILLDRPSVSSRRVSFCMKPIIKEIAYNNGKPRRTLSSTPVFEIKDLKVFFNVSMKTNIKNKASRFMSKIVNKDKIMLKYKRKCDMETDLRALGLIPKTYIENKILVKGLGYRETEESVKQYFSQFGTVEKVLLEKNSKGRCTGRGTITFTTNINTSREFRLNNRLIFIERLKKQHLNTTRLHISHINKDINISKMRLILKSGGFIPKNIRIDMTNSKNNGYGFVEFKTPEEAYSFIEGFGNLQELFGLKSYVEFSKEKKNFLPKI